VKYRPFGRTGWQVSEIAFGAWQIGGEWGKLDDDESVRTLLHAYEQGINFVDTAELYGKGHSEEVIGRSLKAWRGQKVYVATKAQPVNWPEKTDDNPMMRGRYPDWYLRKHVEGSLKRLGVERIDLYQLHCWVPRGATELDWLETLNDLRQEGKIDQIGVSIRDYKADEGVNLAQLGLVASQQVVFNLFEQTPRLRLFPAGEATEQAYIARVPLDSGALTGTWSESTYSTWEKDSIPAWLYRGDRFMDTYQRMLKLKALCAPYYPTLAEAAIRYVLSEGQVSTLIPGMKNAAEVDMNVRYSDGQPFPEELKARLAEHLWVRDYYL
jgi:aryl-alcohol dehydrogenase-like predicted oxidoreductase